MIQLVLNYLDSVILEFILQNPLLLFYANVNLSALCNNICNTFLSILCNGMQKSFTKPEKLLMNRFHLFRIRDF